MTTIYLVRHGQNEDNAAGILNGHRDLPLTEKGRDQAQQTALHLQELNLKIDHILSSPLSRAYETATLIAEHLGIPQVEKMPLLIERNFGCMTGVAQNCIKELCAPDILETETITYFLSPEGAETFPDLIKRGKCILEEISTRFPDKHVLLTTHGDIGKMIYAAYYQLQWEDVLRDFHFGNCEVLELSQNELEEHKKLVRIKQHNI